MQCDYCESKATVFFTQIIDGQSKKSSLCEKCATEHGVTDPEGFLIGHIQPMPKGSVKGSASKPMEASPLQPAEQSPRKKEQSTCPSCGFAFEDLKKTGRLGCSQCYQFFREEIQHNLGGMHKGVMHTGRVPEGMLEAFEKRQRLEKLQRTMEEAITAEDYEKAAALRDQIRELGNEVEPETPASSEESPTSQP